MNRGSSRFPSNLIVRISSFNEAPIHESGKCRGRARHLPPVAASMRPRFMNRGSMGAILYERKHDALLQ